VAHALLTLDAGQLSIVDKDEARAIRLAGDLCTRFGAGRAVARSEAAHAVDNANGIINATPVGMVSHPGLPIAADLVRPDHWVADVVYFPRETELLRLARARGCRAMGGGGMAVFQAAAAFRLLTGREPDIARMIRHFAEMSGAPGGGTGDR
jgi:shikimate dehydrogenase